MFIFQGDHEGRIMKEICSMNSITLIQVIESRASTVGNSFGRYVSTNSENNQGLLLYYNECSMTVSEGREHERKY
jgi:hypothetical protein